VVCLLRLEGWLVGGGGTEVDGCADYCEGLCDVSYLHGDVRWCHWEAVGLLGVGDVPGGV
jgi:hypothetical protein